MKSKLKKERNKEGTGAGMIGYDEYLRKQMQNPEFKEAFEENRTAKPGQMKDWLNDIDKLHKAVCEGPDDPDKIKQLRDLLEFYAVDLIDAAKENQALRVLLERVSDYVEHDTRCDAGKCTEGEPSPDGYRMKYAGKWYYNNETPECTCGLDAALEDMDPGRLETSKQKEKNMSDGTEMFGEYTIGQVWLAARTAHQVNRAYCEGLCDFTQPSWEDAPEWQKESAKSGVETIILIPEITPRQLHQSWLDIKSIQGWKYGETKDPDKKEHPCMVEYDALSPEQRTKDTLFGIVVRAVLASQKTTAL